MHIEFSKPIRVLEKEELVEQVEYFIDEGVVELQIFSVEGGGEVKVGVPYFDESLFTEGAEENDTARAL